MPYMRKAAATPPGGYPDDVARPATFLTRGLSALSNLPFSGPPAGLEVAVANRRQRATGVATLVARTRFSWVLLALRRREQEDIADIAWALSR